VTLKCIRASLEDVVYPALKYIPVSGCYLASDAGLSVTMVT
jgi:hypothetical protein